MAGGAGWQAGLGIVDEMAEKCNKMKFSRPSTTRLSTSGLSWSRTFPNQTLAESPMNSFLDRRDLLCGSIATLAAGAVAGTASASAKSKEDLPPESVIVFQGDSITDAGRDRKNQGANDARSLGRGYPMTIAGGILRDHAEAKHKIFNRGISGNKVPDLDKRWNEDCIDLKPNLLSILIGVNDIWHKLNGRYDGTVETYQVGLTQLLERTLKALPDVRIVICEPFVLRCGHVGEKWFPEFDQRRQACLAVADAMSLQVVRFQSMFDEAIKVAPPEYWARDGVHPSMAGHALMAKTWRETVGV